MPAAPATAQSASASRIQPSKKSYWSRSSASQMPKTRVSIPPTSHRRRPRNVSSAAATFRPPSSSTENTTTEPIAAKAPIRWRSRSQSYVDTTGATYAIAWLEDLLTRATQPEAMPAGPAPAGQAARARMAAEGAEPERVAVGEDTAGRHGVGHVDAPAAVAAVEREGRVVEAEDVAAQQGR